MSTFNKQVEEILQAARRGVYGIPENPLRNSSGKTHFWNAYFGVSAKYTPRVGELNRTYVEAGRKYREEIDRAEL